MRPPLHLLAPIKLYLIGAERRAAFSRVHRARCPVSLAGYIVPFLNSSFRNRNPSSVYVAPQVTSFLCRYVEKTPASTANAKLLDIQRASRRRSTTTIITYAEVRRADNHTSFLERPVYAPVCERDRRGMTIDSPKGFVPRYS